MGAEPPRALQSLSCWVPAHSASSLQRARVPLPPWLHPAPPALLLAASLCVPAHLYVWDEPLNYIDVLSRVQVEKLIQQFEPTLLLVEHDRVFLENVCTREAIEL